MAGGGRMRLLAFGGTLANLNDRDFWWFPVNAIPANPSCLAGSVLVALSRTRTVVPRRLAALLPVAWVTSIILSQAAANLVAGGILGLLGWHPSCRAS